MVLFSKLNTMNLPICIERAKKAGFTPILYSIWTQPEFGDISEEEVFVIALPSSSRKVPEFFSCMGLGEKFNLDANFFEPHKGFGSIKGEISKDSLEFVKKYSLFGDPVKYVGTQKNGIYRGTCTIDGSYAADFILGDSIDKIKERLAPGYSEIMTNKFLLNRLF